MRLIDLNGKIHDAYENVMRQVDSEETMAVSYGSRYATRLLLEEFQKRDVSCTQDERPLRRMYGDLFMGIAEDWRDAYEHVYDRTVDEDKAGDPAAQAMFAVAELAYALLAK
nr:MAG TPA: hypothetical protein [Caudoviricetes sp.]